MIKAEKCKPKNLSIYIRHLHILLADLNTVISPKPGGYAKIQSIAPKMRSIFNLPTKKQAKSGAWGESLS